MLLILLLLTPVLADVGTECDSRSYGADSIVCVCSSTSCDLPGLISTPGPSTYTSVTSSRDGLRFAQNTLPLDATPGDGNVLVEVNVNDAYQTIMGFGGAFSDSTGLNILTLPKEAQDLLMRSYFAPEGIGYDLCRVPMAGSDFSTRPYSYDDVEGDVELNYFNLTYEDYDYKLPFMRQAQELSDRDVLIFGSPWSPPAWMKENGMFNGSGGILQEMWQPWSDYFVKFVEAYEAEGVPIWGLTTQNEPLTGFEDWYWNTCAWTGEDMRDWIKTNLGPTLEAAGMGDRMLMVVDHNRDLLPQYPAPMLDDPECSKYVDGVALHWYSDWWTPPGPMDETHSRWPDKFLLYTESCDGWNANADERVILGSWVRAENYAFNIIEDLNHYSTGWVDWNMALDMQGGPNWAMNFVDAPIIINKDSAEFYKQPMFYAMGHFSKFLAPGSVRVSTTTTGDDAGLLQVTAVRDDNTATATIVILNTGDTEQSVSIDAGSGTSYANFVIPAKAISSVIFSL